MKKIALVALMFSAIVVNAQTVSKKVGLTKGQQLEQQSRLQVNMTQEAMGQTIHFKMEGDVTNVVEVKDAVANGFDVSNTIKKVLMNMNAMGQDMKFDSDKKEDLDGQLGQALKGKINVPREFTVNKEGIVTNVRTKVDSMDEAGGMMGGDDEWGNGSRKGRSCLSVDREHTVQRRESRGKLERFHNR